MKFYHLIMVMLFACGGQNKTTNYNVNADSVSADTIMNDTMVKQGNMVESEKQVVLTIKYHGSYCGGARPTEEILAEISKWKPLAKSTVRLVNTETESEYMLRSDEKGVVKTELPTGKYEAFMTSDFNKTLGTGFDPDCKKWITEPFDSFNVKDEQINHIKLEFVFVCNPCDETMKKRQ